MRAVAHFVYIARADALLHVAQPVARGVLFAQKIGYERVHSRRGKQHGGVVFGNERRGRNYRVSLALEKLEIELSECFACQFFHISPYFFNMV